MLNTIDINVPLYILDIWNTIYVDVYRNWWISIIDIYLLISIDIYRSGITILPVVIYSTEVSTLESIPSIIFYLNVFRDDKKKM